MGSTQQQGKTDGKRYTKTVIVTARNLVAAVMATARKVFGKAGERLFGISNPFQTVFRGEAVIENGNVAQFLKTRTDRFGIVVKISETLGGLNDEIVRISKQIVAQVGNKSAASLNEDQLTRIALEYVTQACVIPLDAIEPFSEYLVRAQAYRAALKALNQAQQTTSPEAFAKGIDQTMIERLLTQGRSAWANVQRYLSESPHLAALRTQIDAPILFTSITAWQKVAEITDVEARLAAIVEIRTAMEMEQAGNPYVTIATVERAIARVAGNKCLTGGNEYGVTVGTAIEAMAASRMQGVRPNGGTQVGFDGTPAFAFGNALRGLNGHVCGKVTRKSDGKLGYEFDVTEGTSPTAPLTASIQIPHQQQYA